MKSQLHLLSYVYINGFHETTFYKIFKLFYFRKFYFKIHWWLWYMKCNARFYLRCIVIRNYLNKHKSDVLYVLITNDESK